MLNCVVNSQSFSSDTVQFDMKKIEGSIEVEDEWRGRDGVRGEQTDRPSGGGRLLAGNQAVGLTPDLQISHTHRTFEVFRDTLGTLNLDI